MVVVTPSNVGSFIVFARGVLGDLNELEHLPPKKQRKPGT
jgi:hypothetical protein